MLIKLHIIIIIISVTERKFGDKCESNDDCHFNGSICRIDRSNKKCLCQPEFEATNHIDKCGHSTYLIL